MKPLTNISAERREQIAKAKYNVNRLVEVKQNEALSCFILPNGSKICGMCFEYIKGECEMCTRA
jgi:hypothetical protein